MSNWQWMGNHADAPSAVEAANQAGCGAGEVVFEVNDNGTVGLYIYLNAVGSVKKWRWMGNHADAPSAVEAANQAGCGAGEAVYAANQAGCGAGEAVYAANDAGTVGLYLLR
ncbi:hypothetical protein [Mycobacteroides chelonae]|jgi:hypothetical protein|uniref:hypothetical protein n=2 Tax=Mycobacteroides chelonae TaxID=1774 RepID=UPI0008A9BB3F|nr:hypothetical protein [Mycobacteroides chelonae]MBF9434615.1 hypothetical protein [Mycobacteroides chelonae]MBV6362704.1 hypothetical protein [Mycobacteroides chelonae]MEC4836285.1 hypothetical protein [Mycobacteroides chelonae]MEC4855178.1 hypothetical protein [Mycobacteroides chelonae]MEC4873878.1 hypothetical protein [Mycobacteroides chelonae]